MNKLLKKIYASSVILALFANQFVPTMVNAQETTNSQNTATTAVTPTTSNGVTTQETTTSDSNVENTSSATVGIAQIGKVKVTATNTTGEAPQYTTANRQGTISLDDMEEMGTTSMGFSSELVIGFIFFAAEEFDAADAFLFFTAARSAALVFFTS